MLGDMGRPTVGAKFWFLFAHGAGAPKSSAWMLKYFDLLTQIAPVRSFNYDYMELGKKRPDPLPRLIEAHRKALKAGQADLGPNAILIGKSMGGRVGCHLALEENVSKVVCLGYPLRSMGKVPKLRDEVLLQMSCPALFVQGTRDNLCPLETLREVLKRRAAKSELFVVESGNHSLQPTKTYLKQTGKSETELEADILQAIGHFVAPES